MAPIGAPNPYAQWLFLDAVARCVPEALTELVRVCEFYTDDDETALHVWAAHWGFTDDWALRTARSHVQFWRTDPRYGGHWMMVSTSPRWEPVFPVGPSFNPITETEAAFRARVDAYITTCLATPGLVKTPTKETRDHVEWLALHHVARWTYERLASHYGNEHGYPDVPAISRAITDTTALIGLTLRPRPGRKKLSTD